MSVETSIHFQLYTDVTHLFKAVIFSASPPPQLFVNRPHDTHAPCQRMKCGLLMKSSAALQEQENDLVSEKPNRYPPIYNGRNLRRPSCLSLFLYMPKQCTCQLIGPRSRETPLEMQYRQQLLSCTMTWC